MSLLKINDSADKLQIQDFNDQSKPLLPVLASYPHTYGVYLPGRTQQLSKKVRKERWSNTPAGIVSRDCAGYSIRGSADYPYRLLLPVLLGARFPLPCCQPVMIHRRGCTLENLPMVHRAPPQTERRPVCMALINARSIVNKTFTLNNFFTSYSLDFLLLTETWLKPGENGAFSELLPPSCLFFSSPQVSGRGGGLAAVFNDNFKRRLLPTVTYSLFELPLFVVEFVSPVLCAVVCRTPKYNKSFIHEFHSEFFADILPKYDKLLICRDFNVHVCCPSEQFATV